jgi:ATP-dependent Clp protease ATP-binding subunit ClpA
MPGKVQSSFASVITDALRRARADGTSQIGEEHLFAALLGNPDSRPLLGRLDRPGEAEAVWSEVREARRRGGLTSGEQEALAVLGIDLDEVVASVEQRLGENALDSSPSPARRRRVSLSAEARAVVDEAERQRAARRDRGLTAQHLVLGMVTQPGLFADALSARGITAAGVRDSL